MPVENILKEFDRDAHRFESCRIDTERLIQKLLNEGGLRVHKLESRVKNRSSLEKKINRKLEKYNSLCDITDTVAFRIITFFEDEVDTVAELIKTHFDIDEENSIDKRLKNSDKFGYQSLHHVFSYKVERTNLPEYQAYLSLKCEIQIRSILQHAWAEIEHDIGYKSELGIPILAKRNFMRTAALLETADLEFVRLRDTLNEYKDDVSQRVKTAPETVLIDRTSLESYLEQSEVISEISNFIKVAYGFDTVSSETNIDEILNKLMLLRIRNIEELDIKLKENKDIIKHFGAEFAKRDSKDIVGISRGISIYFLINILILQSDDKVKIEEYATNNILQGETTKGYIDKITACYTLATNIIPQP